MSDVETTILIRTNVGPLGEQRQRPDTDEGGRFLVPLGLPASRSLAQHLKTTLIFLLVDLATREPIG